MGILVAAKPVAIICTRDRARAASILSRYVGAQIEIRGRLRGGF